MSKGQGQVRCVVCKRVCQGRIPKGGDGSALVPYPHKTWKSGYGDPGVGMPGGRVRCEGRFEIAPMVDPPTEEE